jgi:hypothetical protein
VATDLRVMSLSLVLLGGARQPFTGAEPAIEAERCRPYCSPGEWDLSRCA